MKENNRENARERIVERRAKYLAAKKYYEENNTSIRKVSKKFGIDCDQFSIYLQKGLFYRFKNDYPFVFGTFYFIVF